MGPPVGLLQIDRGRSGMGRRCSLPMYLIPPTLALLALVPWAASTGEYHYQGTLLCYDCHTMHYSQTHNWDGTTPVPTTGNANGNWLGSGGPFQYLLKSGSASSPINDLCLACHDGQTFAPDVLGANANPYVRQAGALNRIGGAAPYENWKGHTLDMTATPPGAPPPLPSTASSVITSTAAPATGTSRGPSRSPIRRANRTPAGRRRWTCG